MASTRETLRGRLLDAVGHAPFSGNASLTATSNGAADGTTAVCSTLSRYGNDYVAGWWLILPDGPGGAGSYEARPISTAATAFVSSSGTITLSQAASAQIVNTAAIELSRYDPAIIHSALNQACRLLYPRIHLPIRNETLVVDNRLLNWDFETFAASAFTSWTSFGSPTLAQVTSPFHGTYRASITSAAGAAGGLYQNIVSNPFEVFEVVGKSAQFRCKVWCGTASVARVGVSFDNGSTWTWSDYHDGDDEWEELYVIPTVPASPNSIRCYLSVASGANLAYFDYAWAKIDSLYRYTVPSSVLLGPTRLTYNTWQSKVESDWAPVGGWHIESDGATRYLILDSYVPAGSILRLEGQGALSTMTSDTATTEVDDPMTETLIACAAWRYFAMLDAEAAGLESDFKAKAAFWKDTYEQLALTSGMHSPRVPVESHRAWSLG